MSRWSDQVRDEYSRPVPGVSIYVYKWDALAQVAGDLETLTDDSAAPIANPVISDDDGIYYFNSLDGQKLLELHYGGKVQERELILVGALPVPQATFGGLFINAAALTIPVGMDLISTTGYSSIDKGAAAYVYDAAVDAAYVIAHPLTSFRSVNARGFRLSLEQDITPEMLGATGLGVADDEPSFQATVDLLPAAGGNVTVLAGTYKLLTTPTWGVKDVRWNISPAATFTGAGAAAFLSAARTFDAGLRTDLIASTGSALVNTNNGATGARTVSAKAKGEYHLDAREFTGTWDGVADDTAGLQAAVNEAVVRRATLHVSPGVKAGAITVGGACKIEGVATKSVLTAIAGSYDGWTISSSDVEIRNLEILDAAKSGGNDFKFACGTATIDRTTLRNILTFDSFGFLADSGSGAGKHATSILEDVQARAQRGPGVALTRLFAYGSWTRVAVEFIGVSASNFTAFMVDGAALTSPGGLTINDCNAAGTAGVFANTSQIGFDLKNFSDISIPLARSDSMGGDAFRFTGCNKLEIGKALAQLCDGHGHVLTTVTNSDIVILRAMGRNALSGTASKDGVQIVSGCSGLSIERVFARDMTGHGLNVAAVQAGDVDVGRVQMLSNTGRGVKTVGASAVNIGGGQCSGNTAGNLDLANALHFIDGLQVNAGTKADYQGPVTA